jgi:hypothetical protein
VRIKDGRFRKKFTCGVAVVCKQSHLLRRLLSMPLSSLQRTISTPHSSRLARLASGTPYEAVHLMTFCESIKIKGFGGGL